MAKATGEVLVPFDIGVVYINTADKKDNPYSFSPLRYWGSLYLKIKFKRNTKIVLVPFDIGVVYITIPFV